MGCDHREVRPLGSWKQVARPPTPDFPQADCFAL